MNAPHFTQLSTKVLRPRLPCLGLIKIGIKGVKRQSGRGKEFAPPQKVDHFLVTTRARDKQTDNYVLDKAVHELIGQKPTELHVRFLFDEPEQNFHTRLSAYRGQAPMCEGDGTRAYDRELKREIPCTCPLLGKHHTGEYPKDIIRPAGVVCKPYGVLSVLLDAASDYGGFHVFRTTSWETISAITEALRMFKTQFGMLSFIPFKLRLYPRTVHFESGGQTKTGTAYAVAITLAANMDTAFQIAKSARAEREEALLLSAGERYTPEQHVQQITAIEIEDQRDVTAEFHPEGLTGPDYETVEEDDEPDSLAERIRIAYELIGKDVVYINRKLAEFEGRGVEHAELFEQHRPEIWAQACAEYAKREAAELLPEPEAGIGARAQESSPVAAASPAGPTPSLFD